MKLLLLLLASVSSGPSVDSKDLRIELTLYYDLLPVSVVVIRDRERPVVVTRVDLSSFQDLGSDMTAGIRTSSVRVISEKDFRIARVTASAVVSAPNTDPSMSRGELPLLSFRQGGKTWKRYIDETIDRDRQFVLVMRALADLKIAESARETIGARTAEKAGELAK